MPSASDISAKVTPVRITIAAYTVALLLVLVTYVISFLVFTAVGAAPQISSALSGTWLLAIKWLHEKIEASWSTRVGRVPSALRTPHRPLWRLCLYAPFIAIAATGVVFALTVPLGAFLWIPEEAGWAPSGWYIEANGVLMPRIRRMVEPIVFYFFGEWVGRTARRRTSAFVVVLVGTVLEFLMVGYAVSRFFSWLFGAPVWDILTNGSRFERAITQAVDLAGALIPALVGAYRGSKYAPYFDLALFSRRLPHSKRVEIEEFIHLVEQDYSARVEATLKEQAIAKS